MKSVCILAGGKSSRMGQNKSLLSIGDKTVIELIVEELSQVSKDIFVISNDSRPYENLEVRCYPDIHGYQGKGPLAGLLTALIEANGDIVLLTACDMPFVSKDFATELIEMMENNQWDVCLPYFEGRIHPLFAVYHSRILNEVRNCLAQDKLSIKSLLKKVRVKTVTEKDLSKDLAKQLPKILFNMNTPEEYRKAKEIVHVQNDKRPY
ncbi:molybdopterin-guanine dinucleotide biosynthesis protein A [Bacillus pakistanensis]|uniref:Probable molybdenum cofactor guanylyltransferase n=1 Tax=Rossellomorea pakistanensis TaxID=992288 RepID=A0ABS2NBJ0_9BACI|nr:molybdenum cofactor guanylyltransferase [Bacillus pakistanensis]MBM7585190.1 molybdopterin-guanine dinucleotide biosynthesis protein A [Bacillus pakistanensis]